MVGVAWEWLTAPSTDPIISALGFVLGVIGFGITLLGFGVGLYRLRKLETAAEVARMAVEGFRLRIVHYDAANDATEARVALMSTRRHLANDGWRDVAETYEDARRAMIRLLPNIGDAQRDLVEDVSRMISQIDKQCTIIEKNLSDPQKPLPNKSNISSSIRRHLDLVQMVIQHLDKKAS